MRWDMTVLRESPWYEEILKEGLEKGEQQGLQQGCNRVYNRVYSEDDNRRQKP
jgi:predicted transposase YdaD